VTIDVVDASRGLLRPGTYTLDCPIHPPSERFKHASWWTIPRLVCRCAQYTGQCARGFVFDFNSQQTMESNERGNGLCRLYI
jgi:hypothetical protein